MNANDTLREFNATDHYYKYLTMNITVGVLTLAQNFECFWFLDIIASYQPQLKQEEFQCWKLTKNEDDSAIVTCDDGNGRILKKQKVDWTDFRATTATVWVEFGVALLPSER